MNRLIQLSFLTLFLIAISSGIVIGAPSLTFGTIPASGSITGLPGATIGWGYTLTNTDTGLWFSADTVNTSAAFANGLFDTNNFDSPVVAPGQSVAEAFVANTAGLAELTWNASAPANAQNSGVFELSVTWYTEDPNLCGFTCVYTGTAERLATTPYSAAIVATPEPATAALTCAALVLFLGYRYRTIKRLE